MATNTAVNDRVAEGRAALEAARAHHDEIAAEVAEQRQRREALIANVDAVELAAVDQRLRDLPAHALIARRKGPQARRHSQRHGGTAVSAIRRKRAAMWTWSVRT